MHIVEAPVMALEGATDRVRKLGWGQGHHFPIIMGQPRILINGLFPSFTPSFLHSFFLLLILQPHAGIGYYCRRTEQKLYFQMPQNHGTINGKLTSCLFLGTSMIFAPTVGVSLFHCKSRKDRSTESPVSISASAFSSFTD